MCHSESEKMCVESECGWPSWRAVGAQGAPVPFLPGSSPYTLSSSMAQLCWCLGDCSPCKLCCWLKTEREHIKTWWHELPRYFCLRWWGGIGLVTPGHCISRFLPGLWGLRELQLPLRMTLPWELCILTSSFPRGSCELLSPWAGTCFLEPRDHPPCDVFTGRGAASGTVLFLWPGSRGKVISQSRGGRNVMSVLPALLGSSKEGPSWHAKMLVLGELGRLIIGDTWASVCLNCGLVEGWGLTILGKSLNQLW